MWASTATNLVGVFCCGHVGVLLAQSPSHSPRTHAEIEAIIADGQRQKHAGRLAEAITILHAASRSAQQHHELQLESKALVSSAGCQILLFRYRQALSEANKALELAIESKDDSLAGAAAGNLATVYAQLGDFGNAQVKARQSVAYLRSSPRKDYLARALYNYGDIEAEQNNILEAKASYIEAIAVARKAEIEDAESSAELHLGESYLDAGDYANAGQALTRAEQLFIKNQDADDLASAKADIAELEFDRRNYSAALQTLDSAISSRHLTGISPYIPTHLRGQILLALGRQWDALMEFRKAVNQASRWRQGALPGDATSIRTVSYLHDVYQDFTMLAATLAVKTHNTVLAREAVEILADSRAASLREQLALALDRKGTLPPEYFELLSQLQTAQARVTLSPDSGGQAKLEQVRLKISELENRLGIDLQNTPEKSERNSSRKSLRNIQRSLKGSELLLSFCLGKDRSFLWAITSEQVKLYELLPGSELAMHAEAYSDAIRRGLPATNAGRLFGNELFSQLDRTLSQRADWLIVADGALLEGVPFSALPDPSDAGTFLAANHRLRFIPSEALLGSTGASANPQPRFLGIGDPIYNLADSRRSQTKVFVNAKRSNSPVALARLVGSDREIRTAAKMSGLPETQFLVAANASSAKLRSALASRPEVIHFAVHVVSPEGKPEQAALALSLAEDDIPELLTPEAISAFRIPNSLVVLSGCSSQQGKALPSAGLIGLSRAWLLAGAAAVVVSAWPTPDDSGHFFSSFYSHLETNTLTTESLADRAATALQLAQKDMQHSGGYRSLPSFWAAYSIVSKE